MPLPPFTEDGDLPIGVHRASLREVAERFGMGTSRRRSVAARLERIYRVAHNSGHLSRFVVFSSFVTNKPDPNDIDVFLVMHDSFDSSGLRGEVSLLFDHAAADAYFGASVFWVRQLAALGGEQMAVEYWQVKRSGGLRGIVEIVEETS